MPSAVWLVDAESLGIVAANAAAATLHGAAKSELIGRPVLDFAVTPQDHAFWSEVAWSEAAADAIGAIEPRAPAEPQAPVEPQSLIEPHTLIESQALVRRADGAVVPVTRRVSRVRSSTGAALYVVVLDDRSEQVRRERELECSLAELQATLESLDDGVLVTDLHGRIRHFNHRFAELWHLPDEMRVKRADDGVLDWMRRSVANPARYLQRLAAINAATTLRATDVLRLRSGRIIERVTVPQRSRGQPIGRVYTYRDITGAPPPQRSAA